MIDDVVALGDQGGDKVVLQLEPGVVAADVYAHGSTMSSRLGRAVRESGDHVQDRLLGAGAGQLAEPEKASNLAIASKICPASSPRGGWREDGTEVGRAVDLDDRRIGLKARDLDGLAA